MLTDQKPVESRFAALAEPVPLDRRTTSGVRRTALEARLPQIAAFLATAALVVIYALRGGAYDLVAFTEYGIVLWSVIGIGFAVGWLPRSRPSRAMVVFASVLLVYAM